MSEQETDALLAQARAEGAAEATGTPTYLLMYEECGLPHNLDALVCEYFPTEAEARERAKNIAPMREKELWRAVDLPLEGSDEKRDL